MKIEHIRVFGFESALRGMRNPKDSWDKSDSTFWRPDSTLHYPGHWDKPWMLVPECPSLGPDDMKLACSLIKGGTEHRKFLRQIMVWMDITVPRYCWQELDTYKVSTVRMSCSTMHKLGHRELVQGDFEQPIPGSWLDLLNADVRIFQQAQKDGNKALRGIRRGLKNLLPEGYLQKATYSLSYETALSILRQRYNHRLDEWHWEKEGSICWTLLRLPYIREWASLLLGEELVPRIPSDTPQTDSGNAPTTSADIPDTEVSSDKP